MENVLSRELCAFCTLSTFYLVNFVDLFYADGSMRHTAKSNLLNEIEINKNLLPSLMGNPDFGATVTDFIAILQSIDYSKFERFSNVADEISTKLVSGFFECEALVAFTDGYDFEFSIEAAERKRRTATQIISRKLKLLIAKNFQKHFKVSLEIRTIKPTCSNNLSKRRETLPKVLTSFQTNYLASLDGATCRVSHRSKRLIFIATTKKLTRKCLSISNSFMIIFV